jgi:hypothetical protein
VLFRGVSVGGHFGKQHELPRVAGIDLHAVRMQHAGEALAKLTLRITREVSSGRFECDALRGKPPQTFHGLGKAGLAALTPAAANSAAISVSWDAKTNRLVHVTPPWMTRNLQPATLKVMNPGSAAIHRRLAVEILRLAKAYQLFAKSLQAESAAKPQPQSSAPAASCSSQLPATTWHPQARMAAIVSSGSAQ